MRDHQKIGYLAQAELADALFDNSLPFSLIKANFSPSLRLAKNAMFSAASPVPKTPPMSL
jgi:hypothetical protein